MQQHIPWQKINRRVVYNTPHLRVYEDTVKLPNGEIIDDYSVVDFNDVVVAVATDTAGNVIMLQEYRYAVNKTMWNLPAGAPQQRGQEDPMIAAVRELKEETGYEGDPAYFVAKLHDYPTKAPHDVFVYRITNARKVAEPRHEATEHLRVKLMPPDRVKELLLAGEIQTTAVLSSLVMALPQLLDA